nr:uncharacterized protein LOC109162703 [Ipomoea batatas]GMD87834.1 uncharacterized protein LOC109162703 [Ipomoea batatas]
METSHELSKTQSLSSVATENLTEDCESIDRNSKKSKTSPEGEATPMEVEGVKFNTGTKRSYKESVTGPQQVSRPPTNPGGGQSVAKNNKYEPRPETTEKYGAWMLAPRRDKRQHFNPEGRNNYNSVKDRSGNHLSNGSKATAAKVPVCRYRNKAAVNHGFISESRFTLLSDEGLEENHGNPESFKENNQYGSRKGKGKEPIKEPTKEITNKGKGKRKTVQISEKQVLNDRKAENKLVPPKQQTNTGYYERASTSRAQANQNRAAAEDTHTVVRGSKNVTTTVSKTFHNSVSDLHSLDILEGHHLAHHGDPPSLFEDPMEEEPWHECSEGSERSGIPEGDAI